MGTVSSIKGSFYWNSHWEKWYEHYSFLSVSATPVIKWEDQEELKIPASKDLACLWMRQEDTKINDLQDQSMLNTCICRKVLLTAHGKKQCHHKLVHFALREKNDQLLPLFWLLFICSSLPGWLCWAASGTGDHKITFLSPLHPVACRRSARFWLTGCSARYLRSREAMPRNKQPVWKLSKWISVWP